MNIFLSLFCYFISVNLYSAQGLLRDTDEKLSSSSYTAIQHTIPHDTTEQYATTFPILRPLLLLPETLAHTATQHTIPQDKIKQSRKRYVITKSQYVPIFDQLSLLPEKFALLICEYAQDYQGELFPCITIKNTYKGTSYFDITPSFGITIQPLPSGGFASANECIPTESDIKIWSSDGTLRHTLSAPNKMDIVILPNSNVLISSGEGNIKLWDFQSGKCFQTIINPGYRSILKLSSNQFVTYQTEKDKKFRIILWVIQQQQATIQSNRVFDFVPSKIQPMLNTNNIIFTHRNSSLPLDMIILWNPMKDRSLFTFYPYRNIGSAHINDIVLLSQRYLATTNKDDGEIQIWDLEQDVDNDRHHFCTLRESTQTSVAPRLLPLRDGKLLSISDNGTINLWDIACKALYSIIYRKEPIECIAELSNEQIVVASKKNGRIEVYDQHPGTCRFKTSFNHHSHPITTIQELSNGKIVSADTGGTAIIWDSM